ncbi:MAG: hypothetical protein Q9208_005484 [Pyrenodesmia sp. 3 TL-2023]
MEVPEPSPRSRRITRISSIMQALGFSRGARQSPPRDLEASQEVLAGPANLLGDPLTDDSKVSTLPTYEESCQANMAQPALPATPCLADKVDQPKQLLDDCTEARWEPILPGPSHLQPWARHYTWPEWATDILFGIGCGYMLGWYGGHSHTHRGYYIFIHPDRPHNPSLWRLAYHLISSVIVFGLVYWLLSSFLGHMTQAKNAQLAAESRLREYQQSEAEIMEKLYNFLKDATDEQFKSFRDKLGHAVA